jgi:hypothetical protein
MRSPHFLALGDLVEQGKVRFWQDDEENYWYDLTERKTHE